MAATKVGICNRGLQLLGARRITALDDPDSTNATAMNAAYDAVLEAELRSHPWSFATKRAQLPALATGPEFGPSNYFELPADYLRLLPRDDGYNLADLDWQIEGRAITTSDAAPLQIRYTAKVDDPTLMDALFREALSAALAMATCEEITQSNSKLDNVEKAYDRAIAKARKLNAFERPSQNPPEDSWLTARY